LREQLIQILESAADVNCLGAFTSAEAALPQIPRKKKKPDVSCSWDIKLPGMSGIQCVAEIKKVFPTMQVIMVTVYEDSERIFPRLEGRGQRLSGQVQSAGNNCWRPSGTFSTGGSPMSSHIASKVVRHFHLVGAFAPGGGKTCRRGKPRSLELLACGFILQGDWR